jgi:hypothetical protein
MDPSFACDYLKFDDPALLLVSPTLLTPQRIECGKFEIAREPVKCV